MLKMIIKVVFYTFLVLLIAKLLPEQPIIDAVTTYMPVGMLGDGEVSEDNTMLLVILIKLVVSTIIVFIGQKAIKRIFKLIRQC